MRPTPSQPSAAVVIALAFAITGCHEIAETTGGRAAGLEDTAVLAKLQDHLDQFEAAGITGVLAEMQVDGDRALERRGSAKMGEPDPVPWDARFRVGSATKSFVAVVLLQLVGEGKLGLTDSLEDRLPGVLPGNGYDARRITVRDLLQHTSGIPNYTNDLLSTITPDTYQQRRLEKLAPSDLVAIALTHPPDFAPGTAWSYSNTNYILAGMIIERVTGRDWKSEVRERIIEPLRLEHTSEPGNDPDIAGPHAHGYEQFTVGGPLVDVTLQNQTWADAAGSLISTTGDLASFWRALMQGRLLRPTELAEMQRTVLATEVQEVLPGARYGLGLMEFPSSCGPAYWGHFGDTLGFSTRNAVSGDGRRAVVVSLSTNLAGASVLEIFAENRRLLDDAMCAAR